MKCTMVAAPQALKSLRGQMKVEVALAETQREQQPRSRVVATGQEEH